MPNRVVLVSFNLSSEVPPSGLLRFARAQDLVQTAVVAILGRVVDRVLDKARREELLGRFITALDAVLYAGVPSVELLLRLGHNVLNRLHLLLLDLRQSQVQLRCHEPSRALRPVTSRVNSFDVEN